ncbi:MAG: universal stress protein [Salibacteraceae bacterium]
MKTILLPTDFSETAQKAADYAIHLFGLDDVKYILLNAYQVPHAGASMLVSITDILRQESERDLADETSRLEFKYGNNLALSSTSVMGDVLHTVEKLVETDKVTYVVVGTNGASGLKEVLVGSNAAAIIRKSKVPVLVVPLQVELTTWKKVVLATDYSAIQDARVLDPLLNMCMAFNSKVNLLNVRKEPLEVTLKKSLIGMALDHAFDSVEHEFCFVENNDVVEGLEHYLHEVQPDLVAMIPRHTGFLDRIFHRSVTNRIAMHTTLPLLTLPIT